MSDQRYAELVAKRAELLAELLLSDLGAKVSKSPLDTVDFLACFDSSPQALHVMAVEVKARDTPIPSEFAVDASHVARAAKSNIPTLLLVVDVKQNEYGYAWLDEHARGKSTLRKGSKVHVPLTRADQDSTEIREHVLSRITAHA